MKKQELPKVYELVLSLIGEGEDKATTVKELSKRTGLNSTVIRSIVSNSVTQYGLCISTSNRGYYFISNTAEREQTVRNLRSRAFKMLQRAKVIEQMPDPNQQELTI